MLPIFDDSEHLWYTKSRTVKSSRACWWYICSTIRYIRWRIIFHFTDAQQRPDGRAPSSRFPLLHRSCTRRRQHDFRCCQLQIATCCKKKGAPLMDFPKKLTNVEDDRTWWINFLGCHFSPRPLPPSGGHSILLISSIGCAYNTIFEMNTYQSLQGCFTPMPCLVINPILLCSLCQCKHVRPREKCFVRTLLGLHWTIANGKLFGDTAHKILLLRESHLNTKAIDYQLKR